MNLTVSKLTYSRESKQKTAFYASDVYKPSFDLYHKFIGTPESNQTIWTDTLRMGAGKGAEEAMLEVLKQSGFVDRDYKQEEQGRVDYETNGIPIHGYIDAITVDGYPLEIKTINNKNSFDIKKYDDGYPRENYVGQLAIYMDFLKKDKGYLFVASIDGLNTYLYTCTRDGDIFTCGHTKFNLKDELNRWKDLWDNNIKTKVEPDIFEYYYKVPVDKIDWSTISKSKIVEARNNRAVIGDFQVKYSPFKDLWIKKQGVEHGYTAEELIQISNLTKGYTNW